MKPITIAAAFVVCAGMLTGCGGGDDRPREYKVTYEVSGLGTMVTPAALITLQSSSGTYQITTKLPYTYGPVTRHEGDFLYVSAQNINASGSIYVSISADGKSIASGSSYAAYGIATASKTCC
ncbi:MAG: hypothetical protein LBI48_02045 [Burkholderiaceae bacterium]|nr:hypothetical protein [Burkholderiaceae bacterium]